MLNRFGIALALTLDNSLSVFVGAALSPLEDYRRLRRVRATYVDAFPSCPRARLAWRNVSTHNLRDFEGYDGERLVARILQEPNGNHDWRWSVFAICPAIPGLTNGVEADPKEARRKVETAWQMAKEKGWRDPSGQTIL